MGSGNRLLVGVFIIMTFAVWIAFDAWLGPNGGPTESQVIKDWATTAVVFPHVVGFLVGHWFFPRKSSLGFGWMIGLGIWALLGGWDIYWHLTHAGQMPWFRFPGLWAFLGIISGSILWNQKHPESPLP